ncbi:MAG TPA: hypothetical protein VFE57_05225, partial [Cyclobacteriaceae bacterium]|nr:hypothetical protein [Cyclobacteriaceae bacterium]
MMFSYFFHQKKFFSTLALILILGVTTVWSQTVNYTKTTLNVDVTASNPCGGIDNGFITFKVNNATGPSGSANIQIFGPTFPTSQTVAVTVNVGSTFTFNPAHSLIAGTYYVIIVDNNGSDIINSFAGDAPVVLSALPVISLNPTGSNNLVNSDCALPLEAVLEVAIGGGSTSLGGGGSFNYTWSSTTAMTGMPKSGTVSGTSPVLNLNSLLGVTGLPGGTYTLLVTDKYSSCSQTINQTITDPTPQDFTVSTSTPTICAGNNGTILLSSSESAVPAPGVVYTLYSKIGAGSFVSTGITSAGTGASLNFNVPAAQLLAPNTYTFQITASNGVCAPKVMTGNPTITVKTLPVPTIIGTTSVCINSTGNVYTTESGMTNYIWNIPAGGNITSGGTSTSNTATVTWT